MSTKSLIEKKIKNLFTKLKIKSGDNILIHSNLAGLYQFDKKNLNKAICKEFFFSLHRYIGPKGTILIPAYNYQFTKKKRYNRLKTSSEVGEFGNWMVENFPFNRTNEPIFSHFVFGNYKKKIFNCSIKEAFGKESIFNFIHKKNFKILCFCCSPKNITFIHFIEKANKVSYRYEKFFQSKIFENNSYRSLRYKYFVGKKKFDYSIKEEKLINAIKKKVISKKFGRFICYLISTKSLYQTIKYKLKNNDHYLIK